MEKIKTFFLIVCSLALGWNLKGLVVTVQNRAETLQAEKPAEPSEKFAISKAEVSAKIVDLDKLSSEIRAVPYYENSELAGMKILDLAPGSVIEELGFQKGDVVKKINKKTFSVENIVPTFETLKTAKQVDVVLDRQGTEQLFRYNIGN